MPLQLRTYSFRFAEEIMHSKLSLKKNIESLLTHSSLSLSTLSRPKFNEDLDKLFVESGWQRQPAVFNEGDEAFAKMDFLKDRVGIEVEFGHASFIGIDLLKFQVSSYSFLDKIDIGVYVTTTSRFQKTLAKEHSLNWEGSLSFEKVCRYLPLLKSAIQVPVFVYGIDIV
jgi:hypothetical protein